MSTRILRLGCAVLLGAVVFGGNGCSCKNETPDANKPVGPRVDALEPSQGPAAGGTVVLLRGDRFAPTATVKFGGTASAQVVVADATTLTALAPAGGEGPATVTVANPDGLTSSLVAAFTYVAGDVSKPTVVQALPAQGPKEGGSMIEVHGTGFVEGALAFIGGRPAASVTVVSAELLTLVTPSGVAGPAAIAVTNRDGGSGTLVDGFSYYAAATGPGPKLASIAPAQGPTAGGLDAYVSGTDLIPGVRLYLGGLPVGATTFEAARVGFKTPAAPPGTVDVYATNPDGQSHSLPKAFNYFVPPPVLTRVDPADGPVEGGTLVAVHGRNFARGMAVNLGGKPLNDLDFVDAGLVRGKTPAGATFGWVACQAILAGGLEDSLPEAFYYTDATHPAPGTTGARTISLLRAVPSSAPSPGGLFVTLIGDGFQTGAQVRFGGTPGTEVRVLGSSSITVKAPAGAVGPATIEVENPDRGLAKLANAFYYFDPTSTAAGPRLSGIAPSTSPTGGGARALVLGANFLAGAKLLFNGVESPSVKVLNATQLTAIVPPAASAGTVPVTVSNPDGKTDTLASGFSYFVLGADQRPPSITTSSPAFGSADAETNVSLGGDGFQPGAQLFAGELPAAAVNVPATSTLEGTLPAQPAGKVDLEVVNPDGLSGTLALGFEYRLPLPKVASALPDRGPLAGGIAVLLLGENFARGATVTFGRTPAVDVTYVDTTALRATAPSATAGKVDLVVTNPNGQSATLKDGFEYDPTWVAGPKPSLSGVQPDRGPSTGNSAVLVKGAGFVAGARVYFADLLATEVLVLDPTSLYAVTPAAAPGPAHVSVVNPDGQTAVLAGGFTYLDPAGLGAAPTLTGASPNTGKETGATTTLLTGKGFKSGAFVFFGGFPATNPRLLSATIFQVEAPPHAPGPVDLAFTNPDGQSAILKGGFTYVPRPTVDSVTPDRGPTAGGTHVLVAGEGFAAGIEVVIGGAKATSVNVRSVTLLDCDTPAGLEGLADVTVTNADGQTSTLALGFAYVSPPTVTSIVPGSGPTTGGTIAVLTGESFADGALVRVGGKAAVAEFIDDKTLIVQIPAAAAGFADVTVANADGQQSTAQRLFLYKDPSALGAPPSLASIVPGKGPQPGGTLAVFAGANFQPGVQAFVGMRPVRSLKLLGAASLTAITPAAKAPGKVAGAVTNPDGQTSKVDDAFEYVDPATLGQAPALTTLLPQEASIFGGTTVSGAGSGFLAGALFFFDGRPATNVVVSSATTATFAAPTGAPGPVPVAMTNPDGQTATYPGTFTYIVPPPEILVVNPSSGTARGGTPITITGHNFQDGAVVQLAGAACVGVKVVDPTRIDCTTPPGVDGPAAVKVTNADTQSATLAAGFAYVAPPDAQKVSPTSGPLAGGTALTIVGTFFRVGATVIIGNKPCDNVARVSAALLNCTTPAAVASGPAAVVVTNPDGQTGTIAGGFTYLPPIPPPTVTSVAPPYGSVRGGSGVTVVGGGFQAGARVFLGGSEAAAATVMSAQSISVITPLHAVGKVDVVVTNPDSQSATLTAGYEYIADVALPALRVTSITPNTGSVTGNTTVTIAGNGFQAGLAVTIGAKPCTTLARLGPTALTCVTPSAAGPGGVPVTVTNPDGQQVVVNNGFTYDALGRYVTVGHNLPAEASYAKRAIGLVDIDKDLDLDVFETMAGWNGSSVTGTANARLRINDGSMHFLDAAANLPAEVNNGTPQQGALRFVDANKDGAVDVLFINENWLIVYLNDGGGGFVRSQYPMCTDQWGNPRGANATGFTVGDFDKDGAVDVAVARWSTTINCWNGTAYANYNGELIMQNDGTGKFAPKWDRIPQVGDDSTAIETADFDKDGDLDLVVINETNHQTRLYYNDGTGHFTDVSLSLLGVSAGNGRGVAVGDIDKDGDLDILIGFNGQRNRLYVNDGFGKFTDVTLTARMPNDVDPTLGVWLVDYDNDGDLDLLTRRTPANGTSQPMRIYRNDGTGFFGLDAASTVLPPPLAQELVDVAFGDVDRDGYVDMLWAHHGSQDRLLLNDTAGHFVRKTVTDIPEEQVANQDAVVVDVDGDGDRDVVVCGTGPMRPKLFLNDGAGNLVDYTASRMPDVALNCYDVEVVDVNGDGFPDLLISTTTAPVPSPTPSGATGASVYLYLNNGTGFFTDATYPRLPTDAISRDLTPYAIKAIDYDGDGDMDLLIARGACAGTAAPTSGLRLWQNANKNTGIFIDVTPTSGLNFPTNCYYTSPATPAASGIDLQVGDLNNDGLPDVLAVRGWGAGYQAANISNNVIFFNNGNGSFTDVTASKMANPTQGRRGFLFDADGDGDLDIYLANYGDDRLYLNTGGGLYSDVTPSNLPRQDETVGAVVVDVNKDGSPDLVTLKRNRARPRVLINSGLGIFSDYTTTKMPLLDDDSYQIVKGDLTGDGDPELIILNNGQPRVLQRQP